MLKEKNGHNNSVWPLASLAPAARQDIKAVMAMSASSSKSRLAEKLKLFSAKDHTGKAAVRDMSASSRTNTLQAAANPPHETPGTFTPYLQLMDLALCIAVCTRFAIKR
jgi:hypothetical protein